LVTESFRKDARCVLRSSGRAARVEGDLPASRVISVAAAQGVVTLRGLVPTFAMLGEIERAVWSIPGVTQIDNQLQVF
jgi:osmotically-inducible protein OsmY